VQLMRRVRGPGWPALWWLYMRPVIKQWGLGGESKGWRKKKQCFVGRRLREGICV
jgi:hypothetical protein